MFALIIAFADKVKAPDLPRITRGIFSCVTLLSSLVLPQAQAADGELDLTFGNNGTVTSLVYPTPAQHGEPPLFGPAEDVAIQPDGKIVVLGNALYYFQNSDIVLMRFHSNGARDRTFGENGIVATSITEGSDICGSMLIQADGKIVVVGSAGAGYDGAFVARFNSNGSFDSTFGSGGKVLASAGDPEETRAIGIGAVLQSDKKIVVLVQTLVATHRFGLFRLNSNGSRDNTFGNGGEVITDFGGIVHSPSAISIQKDGKLVVAGSTDYNSTDQVISKSTLARYNSNGSLDNSFSGDGKVTEDFSPSHERIYHLAPQTDGKIVALVYLNTPGGDREMLVRFNADGSLDSSFNPGRQLLPLRAKDLTVQRDGKFVLVGTGVASNYGGGDGTFVVARHMNDGSPDPTFGTDGKTVTPFPESVWETANAVAIQGNGKIVAAGVVREMQGPDACVLARYTSTAAPNSLSINNARTINEGSATTPGSTTFTIALSAPKNQSVTVNYRTANGTATAGSDYIAKSGTLTFAPGETLKRVTVNFIGDDVAEANETFFLDLRTAVNATIIDSRGSAYIGNDDGPGITIENAKSVTEGNSGTTAQEFVVKLSAASTDTITVDYATANGPLNGGAGPTDFTAASGRLTFAPGETQKTISVQVKGDTTVEPNEKYFVNLTRPTFAVIADSQGSGFIINDDSAPGIAMQNNHSQ